MKRQDGMHREPRNVLRSGGLGKPRTDLSKPKLTLDLSNRFYSAQEATNTEQKSSSRRKSFGSYSCRAQNKENDLGKGNQGPHTTKSKDMLDSYRSSRNMHYLQRNDIFKYVKPPQRDEFDFRVSTSFKSDLGKHRQHQGAPQVPPTSQAKRRILDDSPQNRDFDDVAKKINFNPAVRDSQIGSSASSLGLTNLQLSLIANQNGHDNKSQNKRALEEIKNFNNRTGMEIFGNRRLSVNTRSGSRSNVRNKMADEFSDPSAIETEEILRNWDKRCRVDTNENSLKLCLSYYDVNPHTLNSDCPRMTNKVEEKRNSGTEVSTCMLDDMYQVKEPSDCVMISGDDNNNSFEKDRKESRAANLESMKTIKEVEEKEEIMGYTSQKESQQSNFNQGSFQNLIEKYCKPKENIFLASSGRESFERTQPGFTNTQMIDLQINNIDAIQEEELNHEAADQEMDAFYKKVENLAVRIPSLSLAHSVNGTEKSKHYRDKSDVSMLHLESDIDRDQRKASPFSAIMTTADCLKTEISEERSTSRGHSRSHSTYSRSDKLDAELEKLLKNIEQDSRRSQDTNNGNYSKPYLQKIGRYL
jgi:hypothetical protein